MNFYERLKHVRIVRSLVYSVVGAATYSGLAFYNKIHIEGTEHLKKLPKQNVLFVSNHQTYFADVMSFIHIFCAVKWRKKNKLGIPFLSAQSFYQCIFCCSGGNHERELSEPFIQTWRRFDY